MQPQILKPGKVIVLLSMIYISLFFASITVAYKIVAFGHQLYCASILIFPLLFPFSDALAELYGPEIAQSMVWYTVICEAIFVCLTNVAIHLPSPPNWHHQAEYNFFVGGYIQVLIANAAALLISFYLNIAFLKKWRLLLKEKYYYLRSLGATAIGEIIYTIITNLIAYAGVLHWKEIMNIILSDYIAKLIYSAIIAYPAALLVAYVKAKYNPNPSAKIQKSLSFRTINKVVDFSSYTKKKLLNTFDLPTNK